MSHILRPPPPSSDPYLLHLFAASRYAATHNLTSPRISDIEGINVDHLLEDYYASISRAGVPLPPLSEPLSPKQVLYWLSCRKLYETTWSAKRETETPSTGFYTNESRPDVIRTPSLDHVLQTQSSHTPQLQSIPSAVSDFDASPPQPDHVLHAPQPGQSSRIPPPQGTSKNYKTARYKDYNASFAYARLALKKARAFARNSHLSGVSEEDREKEYDVLRRNLQAAVDDVNALERGRDSENVSN